MVSVFPVGERLPVDSPRKVERVRVDDRNHPHIGSYGVANSASVFDYGIGTLAEARKEAKVRSRLAWVGACWPVKFV